MTTEAERKTLRQRIAETSVQMSATPLGQRVEKDGEHRWEHWAWRCTLRRSGRRMTITYRMGMALTEKPRLDEVLESLLSEAAGVESAVDFRDWCSEFGYEVEDRTKRRQAEKTYYACCKQRDRLKNLLGDDYEAWLWETDRA